VALFSLIFFKIISILLSIIIGFLAGKIAKVGSEDISNLLFYFIAPIVFFSVPASASLDYSSLSLSIITFFIASFLSIFSFYFFKIYWSDHTLNIIAYSAGAANTGYFMLPIASTLFDNYTLSLYMMAAVGVSLYDCSIGYYMCMRNISSTKDSVLRLLKMPTLISFALGCAFSLSGLRLPDFLEDFIYNMRAAYSVLGMVIIGLGLSTMKKFTIDKKFTLALCSAKFIFYPIAINLFILADRFFLHWFDSSAYYALQLISTAPIAANTMVMAGLLKFPQEKVATSLLLSLGIALIYIPLISSILFENLE